MGKDYLDYSKDYSDLSLDNVKDRMKVVYVGSNCSTARRGATATINLARCNVNWLDVIWDDTEFRFKNQEEFQKYLAKYGPNNHQDNNCNGQNDGRYYYRDFWPIDSPKGKAILQERGTSSLCMTEKQIVESSNALYCSCSNPDFVESFALNQSFQFCRNCKKEKLP